jgi:glycerate kinase
MLPGVPTTVLVAPDSFKGTFTAAEVAGAVGRGLEAGGLPVDLCPVADGGAGTLEALLEPLGGELHEASVTDPLGRPVVARFGLVMERGGRGHGRAGGGRDQGRAGGGRAHGRAGGGPAGGRASTAIVETAAASGLALVPESERDPVAASSAGTGELIRAAVAAGAGEVLVAVGDSATTDGGAGAIDAIRSGGGIGRARLTVLCDVRTPFEDAARVFGPQKGAGPQDVKRLERRLHALARRLPRDPRGVPMTGAAGGLSGGLWAEFDAELVAGGSYVLDAVGFDSRMRVARAVVTGEGRLDHQSLAGKLVSEVATRARQAGVPCYAVVARNELDSFGARMLDIEATIEAGTARQLTAAGRRLAGLLAPSARSSRSGSSRGSRTARRAASG